VKLSSIPLRRLRWRPSWRIVSSRFPPVGPFDRVTSPADLEAVFALEALTNDRLRDEVGDLGLVDPAERMSGPGTTPIMAAFTHPNPLGSRFSDGSFGVYYAAREIETAVEEARFHRGEFLRRTGEAPIRLEMRAYAADLTGRLHDLRGMEKGMPRYFDPDPRRYGPARRLGAALREGGAQGIVYHSVRRPPGQCAAVLRPRVLAPCRQGPQLYFDWDGQAIRSVYEIREFRV